MSLPGSRYYCINHPHAATEETCTRCGRPFCASCLTELLGRRVCGWCRDAALQNRQAQAINPAPVVLWARIFNALMLLGGLALTALSLSMMTAPLWLASMGGTGSGGTAPGAATSSAIMVVLGAVSVLSSFVIYLPPALGLGPGRGWLWTWQLVALILTIVGSCLSGIYGSLSFVPALVLIIFWVKPEVRAYCTGTGAG